MHDLRTAAQQALEACEQRLPLVGQAKIIDELNNLRAALAQEQAEPVLQTCNCRWDGDVQVHQCTLHEAHVDALHEWAERAKTAEKKLAALAQEQAEPVAYTTGHCKERAKPGGCQLHNLHCGYPKCDRKSVQEQAEPVQEPITRLFGTLPVHDAQQAEPVEPVAKVELMMTGGNAGLATRIVEIDDHLRERLRPGQLLYTAPPQRKPLTDEEIFAIENDIPDAVISDRAWTIWFARAIERALEEKNRGR